MLRWKRKSTLLREGRHYAYSMDTPKGDSQQGRRENRHSQREDLHSKKTINSLERELTIMFGLKALANEDTLLPTQMFPHLPARATFVADTNFVSLFRNILCLQRMFPSLRSPRNIMGNNVSATMCPRLPGPLARAHECMHVQNVRDFLQTGLDSEINSPLLLNERGYPRFFFFGIC